MANIGFTTLPEFGLVLSPIFHEVMQNECVTWRGRLVLSERRQPEYYRFVINVFFFQIWHMKPTLQVHIKVNLVVVLICLK